MAEGKRRLFVFAGLLAWCASLLVLRTLRSGSLGFAFLGWNLFLATIPAVVAAFFNEADRRKRGLGIRAGLFVCWLLFLPNAPYVATDLVHLTHRPPVPLWFDAALFFSCGGTGLLLGYSSLLDVHSVVARRLGDAAGWGIAVAALTISAVGLYAGRALRWNSWDVVVKPSQILSTIKASVLDPLSHTYSLVVIGFCAVGLLLGYAALRGLVSVFGGQKRA